MKFELQVLREWNDELKKEFEDFKKDDKMWNKKNQSIYTTGTCTDFIRHWLNKSMEL